jgi:4-hydroxybenzoate polyprenyltransferase
MVGLINAPFVIAYPLVKRYSFYPQVVLGITINFGLIISYFANTSIIFSPELGFLYISAICWTIVYDTIYAH